MDKLGMILDELRTTMDMIAETVEAIEGMSKCSYATAVLINDLEDNVERQAGLMSQLHPFGIKTKEEATAAILHWETLHEQRHLGAWKLAVETSAVNNENGDIPGI